MLFTEAAKVIMNPRCMNCHPASDRPTQGNDMHPHSPPVTRGADGGGVPGNTCGACHMNRNVPIFAGQQTSFQSMPGHARWGLAPIEMAWEGKSIGDICRQIKDPQRNGGRDLALLHEHLAHDDLVGWAWNPGPGRDPRPAPRSSWANWSGPGSTAAPRVRRTFEPMSRSALARMRQRGAHRRVRRLRGTEQPACLRPDRTFTGSLWLRRLAVVARAVLVLVFLAATT